MLIVYYFTTCKPHFWIEYVKRNKHIQLIKQLWGHLKEVESLSYLWWLSWSRWVPQQCVLWLAGLWIWHNPQSCGFLTCGCFCLSFTLPLFFCAFLSVFCFFALYKLSEKDKAGLISWLLSKYSPICAGLYLRGERVFIYICSHACFRHESNLMGL